MREDDGPPRIAQPPPVYSDALYFSGLRCYRPGEEPASPLLLVNQDHLTGVSVEFLRVKDDNGHAVHELVGGAFVKIPSNPDARVLASKAANPSMAMVQAIHDAAYHLGAESAVMGSDEDVDLADGAPIRRWLLG